MKMKFNCWLAALITGMLVCSPVPLAAETNAAPVRIGVYDSRLLAYAQFWSDAQQRKLQELVKAAKQAKDAGDTARTRELETELKKEQDENHLQVFSTAAVDNVLATMQDRIAEIHKSTGIVRLVSKWDEKALNQFARAEQVDVTDLMLREFKLSERQMKVVEDLRNKKPLPLAKAQKLIREGKL